MLLTGAASGIGRQLAEDLALLGHRVVATDLDEPALEALSAAQASAGDRFVTLRLDVREAESWERVLDATIERFGHVDVVFNVAGHLVARWAHEMSLADVGLTIDVNVKGVIFGTNAAARRMVARGSGHIVNIASLAGLVPVPGLAVYSASKHAVRAFSLATAQELQRHGVYVTTVCPGPVDTPMLTAQLPHEEAALTFSASRALAPEEVTRAIVERALVHRPLELVIGVPGSGQATLAKLVGAVPDLATWVRPWLTKIGRRHQSRLRGGRTNGADC